ncbi:hypothetical protein NP233_g11946 [Leucocoprinus birnbaumii]|uniref:Nephrocystin 3-like N-terminal domain-containing protein n=1 Tax=Leucocoprinus birnbaumii TaxID=56174 RepID=A0AAD5VJ61_9AGAR|nr:hypothetical protein NP233_g11946 [Leucocoprinus birnbaumii]
MCNTAKRLLQPYDLVSFHNLSSPPFDYDRLDCVAMSDVPPSSIQMFDGAHDMVLYHPIFVSNNTNHIPGKQGLDKLLAHSMCNAFHDSSDRWPPPRCHYDSRQVLRKTITDWATGHSEASEKPLLWMYGPFGVGKTAVAQNTAEALAGLMKLAASLFFSRPNGRNNPNRIFTSIAYQLTLQCPPFGEILDRMIINNPTILTAALPRQFQELIVVPLRRMVPQSAGMDGWVIILDGFDEIDGIEAQRDIINIIVTSIQDCATPFRWFILSRPEAHIQRTMRVGHITPLLYTLDLPLSSEDDHEILTFLTKELQKIREHHGLSASWCTEVELAILVKLAGGLWIYVNTIIRFIGDVKSFGPQSQLRLVLSLAQQETSPLANHPLAAMDLLYDLVMEQIPSQILLTVRKILLLRHVMRNKVGDNRGWEIDFIANVLRLPIEELLAACGFLQSVLFIANNHGRPSQIQFYHASFMEYAQDPQRSKNFCVWGDSLENLRLDIIEQVNSVHSCSTGGSLNLNFTYRELAIPEDEYETRKRDGTIYYAMIGVMFTLWGHQASAVTSSTAAALRNVAFSYIPRFARDSHYGNLMIDCGLLRHNLPAEYRDKVIRESTNPLHLNKNSSFHCGNIHAFILGAAPNGLICWPYHEPKGSVVNIPFSYGGTWLYETESSMTPDIEEVAASESKRVKTPDTEEIVTPDPQEIVLLEPEAIRTPEIEDSEVLPVDTEKNTTLEANEIQRRRLRWVPKWVRDSMLRSQIRRQ